MEGAHGCTRQLESPLQPCRHSPKHVIPGVTSTHQLKRKKIRKTFNSTVKFTPTVILPGFHITGCTKCSAPQRQDTGQNWPPGVTGSLRSIPQVRLILPTRAQPPKTEFRVLVCYIQLYNWKDGYLSVILVQLRRLRKNSEEPTRTDPWFNGQHRWRQPALSGSPSGSWSPTAPGGFRILRRWATIVMHLERTRNSFWKNKSLK